MKIYYKHPIPTIFKDTFFPFTPSLKGSKTRDKDGAWTFPNIYKKFHYMLSTSKEKI